MRPRFLYARLILLAVLAALMVGCASARMEDTKIDQDFREHHYNAAAARLKTGYIKEGISGRDSLLYVLDLGLALHSAGKYDRSTKYFLQANDLAVIKDYTSISREAATLLTSDNIKSYEAEDFENVLINTYLAMNYALEGDFEDALVEARRTNEKLYMMVSEGKRKYKQSAFARYLSAILYEADDDYNDAYVDYRHVHDLLPGYPGLGKDLWRCAHILGMDGQAAKWDKKYKFTAQDHSDAMEVAPGSPKGEIVVLYENGISPIKRPNPQFTEIPKFYPRPNPVSYADVQIDGKPVGRTYMLDDIEATAIENLKEKYAGIIAKKIAGVAAKELVGYEVGKATHNRLLGALTKFALFASDTADCRSWNLLPHDLQMARFPVDPGKYTVEIVPHGATAAPVKTVEVASGKKVFVDFRFMP